MKNKGFTFIELMISLMLLALVITTAMGFAITNNKVYSVLSKNVDENQNVRIALEYLSREMLKAENIRLVRRVNSVETEQDEITVVSTSGSSSFYLYLDSEKVYIVKEIIRRDTESQQIVSGIKSFEIKNRGQGLYTVTVNGENYSLSTNIYKRT